MLPASSLALQTENIHYYYYNKNYDIRIENVIRKKSYKKTIKVSTMVWLKDKKLKTTKNKID